MPCPSKEGSDDAHFSMVWAHPSSMLQVTTVSASSPPSSCPWLAGLASTLQAPLSISWPTLARTLAGADLHAKLSHPADSEDARSEGPFARLVRGFWACCSVLCDSLQLSLAFHTRVWMPLARVYMQLYREDQKVCCSWFSVPDAS